MPYPFVPGEILTSLNLNAALDMRMLTSMAGMGIIPGAVVFGHATNGGFQTDNANFFYDNPNNRFGLGTNTPQVQFHVGPIAGNPPGLRSYNIYTDPANNEFAYLGDWTKTANVATYGTDKLGTGIVRDVSIVRGGTEMIRLGPYGVTATIASTVHTQPLPVLLGTATAAAAARACVVMGNYAYTTNQSATGLVDVLEIFDITEPTAPVKISGLILPNQGLGQMAIGGNYLYIGINSTTVGIQIVDISNPKVPVVVRQFNPGNVSIQYIALSGAYLYIGQGSTSAFFIIVDVSNPLFPVNKGSVSMTGASGIRSIMIQGEYAYVSTGQAVAGVGGLYVIDISNPTTPTVVATYNATVAGGGLAIADRYLYVSGGVAANGFEVVDISNPLVPVQKAVLTVTGATSTGSDPIIAGNYLFRFNNSANGIQILNITNPAAPVSVGVTATVTGVVGADLSGNRLYVFANSQLRIYDTFGIDAPTGRVGSLNTDRLHVDGPSYFNSDLYAQRGLVVGQAGIISRGAISTPAIDADTLAGPAGDYTQAQFTMSGGGTVTWGGTGQRLKWTVRFVAIPAGRNPSGLASGYVQFDQPVVDIPAAQVHNSVARSADANGVVLNNWEALYGAHTPGGIQTAVTYYVVIYTASFVPPSNWFLIAAVNGDPGNGSVKLGTGHTLRNGGTLIAGEGQYVRLSPTAPQAGGIGLLGSTTTVRNYNLYTDASNNEWSYLGEFAANIATYGSNKLGTGVVRDVSIVRGGTEAIRIGASGVGIGAGNTPQYLLDTYRNDATTGTSSIGIKQAGTGDAILGFLLPGVRFWGMGIDNSDGDAFKIGAAEDGFATSAVRIDVTGTATFYGAAPVQAVAIGSTAAYGRIASIAGSAGLQLAPVDNGANSTLRLLTDPNTIAIEAVDTGGNTSYKNLNLTGAITGISGSSIFFTSTGVQVGRFIAGGYFAIGTASPVSHLHVGTTAASARTFNTFTDAANSEWAYLGDWSGATFPNVATFGSDKNGTGVARDVNFVRSNIEQLRLTATGPTMPLGLTVSAGLATLLGGLSFGTQLGASATDLSKHILLHTSGYGFSITSGRLNYVVAAGAGHAFYIGAASPFVIGGLGPVINGSTSGSLTLSVPAVAGTNTITFPAGTTNFSLTGGPGRVVKQLAAGGPFTVATMTVGELDGTTSVPALLGTAALIGGARGVAVMGNYAYTTAQTGGVTDTIEIWDITVSTAPVRLGGLPLVNQALSNPVVAGQLLYTPTNTAGAGIRIVDVSNPKLPVEIAAINLGSTCGALALSGVYLYSVNNTTTSQFRIHDVSLPTASVQKSFTTLAGMTGATSLALQGKYAFVGGTQTVAATAGLYVIDVSDPALPVVVATYNAVSSVRGLAVAGKYLYVSESVAANGLEVVDISDPALPVQVRVFATTSTGTTYVNPIVAGRYLYHANGGGATSGVQLIDIIDPANPVSIGSIATTLSAGGMALSGNRLYVTANTQLQVWNTAGVEATTVKIGSLNTDRLYVDGPSFFDSDIYVQRGLVVGEVGILSGGQVSASFLDAPTVQTDTFAGPALDHVQGQHVLSGGGTVTWGGPAGRLKWTARFIELPMGRSGASSNGYIQFDQPVVDIPAGQVYNGVARAADATGVVLNGWEALYGVHTTGGNHLAVTYNIVIHSTAFIAPSNWTLIGAVNLDNSSIRLGTGQILKSGGSLINGVDQNFVQLAAAAPQLGGVSVLTGAVRSYNTYTDASNNEYSYFGEWFSNTVSYGTAKTGTGLSRPFQFLYGGARVLDYGVTTAGYFTAATSWNIGYLLIPGGGNTTALQSAGGNLVFQNPDTTLGNYSRVQWLTQLGGAAAMLGVKYKGNGIGNATTIDAGFEIGITALGETNPWTKFDYNVSIPMSFTMGGALKIASGWGASAGNDNAMLNVDAMFGNTAAKFGSSLALYAVASFPSVGFNAYYNAGWKFGKGSAASHYSGSLGFNPNTGDFTFTTSSGPAVADTLATMVNQFLINRTGNFYFYGSPATAIIQDLRGATVGAGGVLLLQHSNVGGAQVSYAGINAYAVGGTVGAEDGDLVLKTSRVGALTEGARLYSWGRFNALSMGVNMGGSGSANLNVSLSARVYNVYTDASNGEWSYLGDFSGATFPNVATYGSDKNGTGVVRDVNFVRGNVEYLRLATGITASVGLSMGSAVAASSSDLSRHIALFGTNYGFSITGSRLNYVGATHRFVIGTADTVSILTTGLYIHGSTSGSIGLAAPAAAGASVITFPVGSTNFTLTGGASRVLKQVAVGAPITVGTVTQADIDSVSPVPVLVGTAAIAGGVRGCAVVGNYAYVINTAALGTDNFEVFDITIPTAPVKVGGLSIPSSATGVPVGNLTVAGHIAYVPMNNTTAAFALIDVSNPNLPVYIAGFNYTSAGYMLLSGGYLYYGNGLVSTVWRIFDVSNPSAIAQKYGAGSLTGASGVATMVIQGKYIFIGTGQAVAGVGGLYIWDISDPYAPVLQATYNTASAVRGLAVAGKYLYISQSALATGLEVLNIEDVAAPVQVYVGATIGAGAIYVNPIVAGRYLYHFNSNFIQLFDINNPAAPTLVGNSATMGAGAGGAVLSGRYLYVTANAMLRVFDTFGIEATSASVGSVKTDKLHVDGESVFAGDMYAQRGLVVGQAGIMSRGPIWTDASEAAIPVSAVFGLGLVCLGAYGSTAFPALKRAGALIQARLSDDSAHAGFEAATLTAGGASITSAGSLFEALKSDTSVYAAGSAAVGPRIGIVNQDSATNGNFSRIVFNTYNSTPTLTSMGAITCVFLEHLAGAESVAFTFQGRSAGPYTERARLQGNNFGVGGDFSAKPPQAMLQVGTTAGTARSYNVYTDTANGEWAYLGDWSDLANAATYGTDLIGTGVARNIRFVVGGVDKLNYGVTTAATWTIVGNVNATTGSITVQTNNSGFMGQGIASYVPVVNAGSYSTSAVAGDSVLRAQAANTLILQAGSGGAGLALKGAMIGVGGTTSAFPGLKRNAAMLEVRLGDDSAYAALNTAGINIVSATGGLDGAAFNVDAGGANSIAKFGASLPVYIHTSGVGFNLHYTSVGPAWIFGKGSTAHYAQLLAAESNTGDYAFYSSTNAGASGATASIQVVLRVSRGGIVAIGAGAALSNTFPALRRSGSAIDIVLGDQSNYAGLNCGTPAFGNTVNVITSAYTTAYYMPLTGGAYTGGISFGSAAQAATTDLSRHIALYSTTHGFSITSGTMNYVVPVNNNHNFVVNAGNILTMGTVITVGLAMRLTSASGAVDFAPFNVDTFVGSTTAKFGTATPVYMVQGPIVGFNAYYNAAWKFGKGSTAHWGGSLGFDAATGTGFTFASSTAAGAADAAATMQAVLRISQTGDRVTWGPGCAFTALFPALRRTGAITDIVTADSAQWGALNTGVIGVQAGGINVVNGTLSIAIGNVQLSNGYLSAVPSPPAVAPQTIFCYSMAVTGDTALAGNCYLDAAYAFKYRTATAATAFNVGSGAFVFYTAPVGTIGATAAFTNRFSIGNTGIVSVNGVQMLATDGTTAGYNKIYAGDATNVALYLGGVGLNVNYYRNTTHSFNGRDQDGSPSWFTLNSTSASFAVRVISTTSITSTGPWLYLNNGSGAINASSGPGVYGDGNWLITKPGANNLGWLFQTYAGVNRYTFNGDGTTVIQMVGGGLFSVLGVTGADIAYQLAAGTSADWKFYLQASTGNLWFYNQKTGALPMYITQTAQTIHQGDVYSVNGAVIASLTVGNASSARLNPGGAAQAGYLAIYNSAATRLAYFGYNNDTITLNIDTGGKFRVAGGQISNEAGAASGIFFSDRTYTTTTHGWYGNGYVSALWYSTIGNGIEFNWTNMTMTVIGSCSATSVVSGASGTFSTTLHATNSINTSQYNLRSAAFAEMDASALRTTLYDPGGANIHLYASGTNYYDQTIHAFRARNGAANFAQFTSGGTINVNGTWGTFSDASLKEQVKPWTKYGLDAISKLIPVSFKYKRGTPFANHPDDEQDTIYGLIAQEVEEIIPEIVSKQEGYVDGIKKMLLLTQPGQLIYVLINAVKELKERLELVEAKLGET